MKSVPSLILLCVSVTACGASGVCPAGVPAAGAGEEAHATPTAEGAVALKIEGLVRTPTAFTTDELRRLDQVSARANEVHRDGEFYGSYTVRGIPLRTLLDRAVVDKGPSGFDKPLDLAIVLTGASGKRAIVSWGEVYYRNASETLVAFESKPVMPHKPCERCHGPDEYRERLDVLMRTPAFPKLVATRDFWGDRFIEGILRIEVVEPLPVDPATPAKKREGHQKLWAESAAIAVPGKEEIVLTSLDGYARVEVRAILAGDGIGYHGTRRFGGIALSELLSKAGVEPDPATALLLTAPDGYRVLLSSAEIFDAPAASPILLADQESGTAIDDGGRFHLVLPGDHAADRWLRSVARIEVVKL